LLAGVDLYRVLGVDPGVDAAELTRAYRRRLRELHPDTRAGRQGGDPARELASVQHAYRLLLDPAGRSRYDTERRASAAAAGARRGVTGAGAGSADGQARIGSPVSVPVRRGPAVPGGWLLRVGPVRVHPLSPKEGPPQR
jgi:DnaJ-class molecular chaperone